MLFEQESYRHEMTYAWQGCEEMRPGDIALMWERKPKSMMTSVWDILSSGFDDPFSFYSGKVIVGNCRRIPDISFKELSADPAWMGSPLIAAHFQGGNGRVIPAECYKAILGIVSKKNPSFDCSILPPPPAYIDFTAMGIEIEHDVEVKLLEPFLKSLGFSKSDWVYQHTMRIGRNNASRPDYIVNVKGRGDHTTADFVIEAKLTIPTEKQLLKDYGQAYAYGKLYMAKIISLVAKEGLWVFHGNDRFEFARRRFFAWTDIKNPDVMSELKVMFS